MARGINKVILIGNLGRDPETKSFPNGGSVTNVTVATSDSWRDKEGNQQERTEWHRVVFHSKLAEIAAQYLRKGSKVYIEGSLRTRKWQDKEGRDQYTTEVHANEMQMLDSRNTGGGAGGGDDFAPAARSSGPSRGTGAPAARPSPAPAESSFEDDDIPF